ncbi:threonine--tRNA ligase [Candidatus Woesearchaeota archaeon]|nr:threonine--tRNA ligase [Candidatus Woesearchaeota archaeon]
MEKITIEFPDKSKKEYDKGISGIRIAESIGKRLAKDAVAIKVNDELKDLSHAIKKDAKIRIITYDDDEGKEIFRHSASHVMADAIKRIFPKAKLTIGPAVQDGFYYDIDKKKPFTPEDMEKIEKEMEKIVNKDFNFKRLDIKKDEAQKKFKENPYKLELINDLGDDTISIYKHGEFFDLCRGPHVPSTGKIKGFKLTKIAGAYWRGDAENKQLQRVYGIAFPSKKELKNYLKMLKEAEKRDHRKIGKDLELFSIHEEGPGFPFFLPNGMVIKNELIKYWREEHRKEGYVEIETPIILNRKLWERSGHWDNYRENMYTTKIDGEDYSIKPMNCPGGMLVYNEKVHSYKELPLRVGELGIVHRHELSGVLTGLFRVRSFTQDDAHIFMTKEQIKDEIIILMDLFDKFYGKFDFRYKVELSTRPEKSIGSKEHWEFTTEQLKKALEEKKIEYEIREGEGAFYGPKIDFHLKDCIGRTWQCGTIQLDMSLPERFDLTYMGKDGTQDHRPFMIHRVVYGSIERFMGILIEHYKGKFPLWLSPQQAVILTVADRFSGYAEKIRTSFFKEGIRIEVDSRSESIGKKVREAQLRKIPLILTVGEKEETNKTIAVRTLDGKVRFGMDPEMLKKKIMKNIADRKKDFNIKN